MSNVATLTAKAAKDILREAKDNGLTGMSKINPQFTSAQVWNVCWSSLLMNFDDDLVPVSWPRILSRNSGTWKKRLGC